MQVQRQVAAGRQDGVDPRREVHQQPGELSGWSLASSARGGHQHQRDVAISVGELREHPVGHAGALNSGVAADGSALPAYPRRDGRRRAGPARTPGGPAGRVAPAHGEPARPARRAGPGAQQRRLPAAGRSRDDRHLPRRRAIQASEKVIPGDHPGSRWSHRQRPALVSTPDTLRRSRSPRTFCLGIRPARVLSTAREPRFRCTLMHAPPRSRPALRCPGAANHHDPVMTSYLPRSNPRPVDRLATENDMTPSNELRCAGEMKRRNS